VGSLSLLSALPPLCHCCLCHQCRCHHCHHYHNLVPNLLDFKPLYCTVLKNNLMLMHSTVCGRETNSLTDSSPYFRTKTVRTRAVFQSKNKHLCPDVIRAATHDLKLPFGSVTTLDHKHTHTHTYTPDTHTPKKNSCCPRKTTLTLDHSRTRAKFIY
jgi:hypothetical protein